MSVKFVCYNLTFSRCPPESIEIGAKLERGQVNIDSLIRGLPVGRLQKVSAVITFRKTHIVQI